jgi:hypothetical protein
MVLLIEEISHSLLSHTRIVFKLILQSKPHVLSQQSRSALSQVWGSNRAISEYIRSHTTNGSRGTVADGAGYLVVGDGFLALQLADNDALKLIPLHLGQSGCHFEGHTQVVVSRGYR